MTSKFTDTYDSEYSNEKIAKINGVVFMAQTGKVALYELTNNFCYFSVSSRKDNAFV